MSDKNCGTCKWYVSRPVQGRAGACGNIAATSDWATVHGYYDYAMPDGDCGGEYYEERPDSVEQVARDWAEWCMSIDETTRLSSSTACTRLAWTL